MSSGLLLIKDPADWERFKLRLMAEHGIDKSNLAWGERSTPSKYPCLSSGVIVESAIVCVFVYPDDARRLLDATDSGNEIEQQLEGFMPDALQDGAWNRHMVALFLAMLHEMISVGLTKEDRFETIMADMLKLVDHKQATDLTKIKELIDREFRGGDS